MVIRFLHLRVRQGLRTLKTLGWPYRLLLLFLAIWAIGGITVKASQDEGSQVLSIAFIAILSSIHLLRPDLQFLKIYFRHYQWLCLIEYLILSLPLIMGLLSTHNNHWVPAYLLGLISIAFFRPIRQRRSRKARSLHLIPTAFFEWKSGIRKYFYLLAVIWLAGMVFSIHLPAVIVSIFTLGIISLGFYNQCEPAALLIAPQQSARLFFWIRVKGLLLVSGIMYLPLLILFFIFHPAFWYIPAIITLVVLSYQLYALTIKYAFYEPNIKSSRNTALLSMGALVFVLPFILPAIWVLTIHLYFRSIRKLTFYLHDFN